MLFLRRLPWLWLATACLMRTSQAQITDPRLALIASSPFRMILRPTATELDFAAIRAVEESIASVMLIFQDTQTYIDVEVVVQQVEYVDVVDDSATEPSSRVRFFCLATALQTTPSSDQRATLDSLVQQVFDSTNGINKFQELLQSTQELAVQDIREVAVAPILPAGTTDGDDDKKTDSNKKLSTLDIILIVISGSIFLGILYMIIQHHKDRGYIENQRIRTCSSPANRVDDSKGRLMVTDTARDTKGYTSNIEDHNEAPSTPSTTNSGDFEFNVDPETPERIRITTVSAMSRGALLSASSTDGSSVQALSETFDNSWFSRRKAGTDSLDDADGYSSSGGSSSSSEDVFQVGVAATPSKSDTSSGQDDKSTVSAISDWMKTICVVPSEAKTSITANSSLGKGPSLTMSSLGQSSLDQRSLEQSMASSSLGSGADLREGVDATEQVEV